MKRIDSSQFIRMPWKNGGGETLEIFRIENPKYPDRSLFRLSMAFVKKDGPFSIFPNIDRTILLLEGDGFLLFKENQKIATLNKKLSPFSFKGEDQIDCQLIGSEIIDFNIMIDRDYGIATTTVIRNDTLLLTADTTTYIFDCKEKRLITLNKNDRYDEREQKDLIVVRIAR